MSQVYLTSCIGLDHDIVLLDSFCRHYISLGIKPENFLLVLNTSSVQTNSVIVDGLNILERHGIQVKDVWCTKYESEEKWARVNNLLGKFVEKDDWVVHPDADEFQEIPSSNYSELFEQLDHAGVNAVQGILVDRLTATNTLPESKDLLNADPFEVFPVCANLSTLVGISGVKLMAYKGYMRANNGSGQIHQKFSNVVRYAHGSGYSLHESPIGTKYLGNSDYSKRNMQLDEWTVAMRDDSEMKKDVKFFVHHFKWHGRVIEKLVDRARTYSLLNRPQLSQSLRILEYYQKHGRFDLVPSQ